MKPGDVIKSKCTYDTTRRNVSTTTYRGFGTTDEMCYGFLVYYPKQNFLGENCVAWKAIDWTRAKFFKYIPFLKPVMDECNLATFTNYKDPSTQKLHSDIKEICGTRSNCGKGCLENVAKLRLENPCMKGDIGDFLKDEAKNGEYGPEFIDFYNRIIPCDRVIASQMPRPRITIRFKELLLSRQQP